jgi:SAM-dependent methyltransferase
MPSKIVAPERMVASLEQHNLEIHENREHWRRKPLLQKVYGQFYREIARRIDGKIPGSIVELGSGMGNIKEHIPDCITTDVFTNPWLDRVENAYELKFGEGTVSHLVLFDVWHHLEFPGTALREFSRVLAGRGRLIVFDPAMGLLGRFVCGLFHHEPLGLSDQIRWEAPPGFSPTESGYYAAQGNASRVFGSDGFRDQLGAWRIAEIAYFSALAYLGSGGFRGPQLYPAKLLPLLNGVDSILSWLPSLASRMLVVLEKPCKLESRSTT